MLLRKLGGLAVSAALLLALTGCAPATTYPTASPVSLTSCLLTQTQSYADNGINQELQYALVQAEVMHGVRIHATSIESWAAPEMVSNKFHALLTRGCQMIFSVGAATSKIAADFASRHQDVSFINFGGVAPAKALRNLQIVHMDARQAVYLAGYLAAAQSKSKIIATFAAANVDNGVNLISAFKQGAERYAATTKVPVQVLGAEGTDPKLWQITSAAADSAGATKIAKLQSDARADVIAPFIGSDAAKFVKLFDTVRGPSRPLLIGYGGDWAKLIAFNGHQGAILSSVRFDMKQMLIGSVERALGGDQIRADNEISTNLLTSTVLLTPEAKVAWVGSVADSISTIRNEIIDGRTVVYLANQ